MRLLLIEDDDTVAAAIATAMTERGHNVARAADGREGAAMVEGGQYDVLVIDRMLPGADGLGMVLGLRARGDATPVLMLTALGTVADRVAGLRGGADDYLVKPFSMDELEARVEALSRRNATPPAQLVIDNLVLDRLARTVQRGDTRITLMPREFQLLELLMLSSPAVVTRTMLLEQVWRFRFDPGTNLVESHVSRLRGKIDRGGDPPLIHTVRGEGYVALAR
ncbi:response regulator transcription factor [Sphingomonas sp. NPDC092331]|jgi:two-component system OmpR family response regulator|uniref:response regulator transcription factor n=1 Tax=unclassified Sphingomonas TaxID=196159 RepID=UPI0029F09E68|nr:response regulator transcription factor [Pseudomonadota bacterium]